MKPAARLFLLLSLCLSLCAPSIAGDETRTAFMSILTGPAGGTYYELGSDIRGLVFPGIDLEVIETHQSANNILSLSTPSDFQLGIIQRDVLESDMGRRLGGDDIQVVLPLYLEEVHLLAGPGVKRISDLDGKKVSVGIHGSGTNFTADALLERLGIQPASKIYLREWRALMALQQGQIDAMFYVVGAPAKFLATNVERGSGIHLVPIELGPEDPAYATAEIPSGTYKWQAEPITTAAVRAWLVAPPYSAGDPDCEGVGRIAMAVRDKLDLLRRSGHAKWQQIEFDEKGLRSHPRASACVVRMLGPD